MGLLDKILHKLGLEKKDDASTPPPATPDVTPTDPSRGRTVPLVDVVSQLEERAANTPQKLNWRTSIVDRLKLLDMDSSYEARKDLAKEMGCPPELMKDSAQMNM